MNSVSIVRDVVLVGGGHSHVLLIRRWSMQPMAGVRLTLVSNSFESPYSGMLPGLIAGHYSVDEVHVDLLRLCNWAGVRFIESTLSSIDMDAQEIHLDGRPNLGFDVLSLDTGSTPDVSVPGALENVTPVKPVYNFFARWQSILDRLQEQSDMSVRIGVVGSGAGGFELMQAILHVLPTGSCQCHWFLRDEQAMNSRPVKVRQLAEAAAKKAGAVIHKKFDVVRVEPNRVISADGREQELDEILWCTAATGPSWPKRSGLAVDDRGFVATNEYLQSLSHPNVFATGDIGTQQSTPSTKAGVFAVRQAPYLFDNIRRFLLEQPLKNYRPQKDFLSLMAVGPKRAIASRGPFAIEADWVWRWKDHIDRKFMKQFIDLPDMSTRKRYLNTPEKLKTETMHCRGCGAKVGDTILDAVLSGDDMPSMNKSMSPAADVAVIEPMPTRWIQSIDQINAVVDDPYLLGKIATLHALSDVTTMPSVPHSALLAATLPQAVEKVAKRDLALLMKGVSEVLSSESMQLLGGHTTQGTELALGVVVNATLSNNALPINEVKSQIVAGQQLVLTQALGIGTLFRGLMEARTKGRDINAAIQAMLSSNRPAGEILRENGALAMTDVTGFGLLGHLQRLLKDLESGAEISVESIPILSGAVDLAKQGVRSSLWTQNKQLLENFAIQSGIDEFQLSLLCDPQTGGGLLAIVPVENAELCLSRLIADGYPDAAIVGSIVDSGLSIH